MNLPLNLRLLMVLTIATVTGTSVSVAAVLRVVFKHEPPERIIVERRLTDRANPQSSYFFRDTVSVTDSIVKLRLNISQPYIISVKNPASLRTGSLPVTLGIDDEMTLTVDSILEYGRYSGTQFVDSLDSFSRQKYEFLTKNNQPSYNRLKNSSALDSFLTTFALSHRDSPIGVIALLHASDSIQAKYFDELSPDLENSIVANQYAELRYRVRKTEAVINARANMTVGKIMPDFALPDSAGRRISLESLRGKWVLIDFWATWCGVCLRGFPDLRQFSEECGDRCTVVTINIDDREEIWRPFIAQRDMPWINLLNDTTDHTEANPVKALGINAIPVTVLIDPEGKIAAIQRGADPEFLSKFKHLISSDSSHNAGL